MVSILKNKKYLGFIIALVILIFQNPLCILSLGESNFDSFDIDWLVGLEWAKLKDMSFGSDIAFTYGPLHFLHFGPMNIGNYTLLLLEESVYILMRFVVIFMFVYFFIDWKKNKSWEKFSITEQALIILIVALNIIVPFVVAEAMLILSCILFVKLIFEIEINKVNRRKYIFNITLNTLILSIICLIKFSYTIAAFTLMVVAFLGLLYKKKAILITYILPIFVFLNLLIWLLCNQDLSSYLDYYLRGFEISLGYTEAMMSDVHRMYIFVAIIIIIFFGISSLLFLLKKDIYHAFLFFILLPIMFMSFKESAVRVDNFHIYSFYNQLVLILFFLLLFCVRNGINIPYKHFMYILFFGIIFCSIRVHFPPAKIRLSPNKEWITNRNPPLPNTFLAEAKEKTVDIFPWDIALLYAYDLNWSPRPVFQSYSVYTQKLDIINSAHFKGHTAPDNVIFLHKYRSIDNRYHLFDEPLVFRTLLENYETQEFDGNYLILRHKPEKKNSNYTTISSGESDIGSIINIPQLSGKAIYCNIDISMNFLGKFMNIFYKPNCLNINLYVKGESSPFSYRFIRKIGKDGLFVSKYVADLSDLQKIFEDDFEQNIEKIQITVQGKNFFYQPIIKYEFYAE
jgi:hypothetical protein